MNTLLTTVFLILLLLVETAAMFFIEGHIVVYVIVFVLAYLTACYGVLLINYPETEKGSEEKRG